MKNTKITRVKDVMKPEFDTVEGMATVADVLSKFEHPETKCLIVGKRNDDDEIGIVMLSDIARLVLAKDRAPERINVYEIMTKPVISVSPEMNIRYCAQLFSRFDLSRAPVVENGNVVGIISFTDMVLKGMVNSH